MELVSNNDFINRLNKDIKRRQESKTPKPAAIDEIEPKRPRLERQLSDAKEEIERLTQRNLHLENLLNEISKNMMSIYPLVYDSTLKLQKEKL